MEVEPHAAQPWEPPPPRIAAAADQCRGRSMEPTPSHYRIRSLVGLRRWDPSAGLVGSVLGYMGMSVVYGECKLVADMVALLRHAVVVGVTFLDTSDVYGPHTNELLLGKALQGEVRDNKQQPGQATAATMGILRESMHKRRATGGKQKAWRKKRK